MALTMVIASLGNLWNIKNSKEHKRVSATNLIREICVGTAWFISIVGLEYILQLRFSARVLHDMALEEVSSCFHSSSILFF